MGVEPDSVDVPYDDDVPTPHRVLDAAVPVIDLLASQLTDTSATILLANADAHIVQRWACRSFLPTLDRFSVAPGFSFAEHGVGTNGIGCAAEEKRVFEVRGPEHFRECLQSLVCVAAPIVLPTTNVVHGVLNVTCTTREANRLLRPLLLHAVADIERRMLDRSSTREREILDAYVVRARRSTNGVIAMGPDIVMANSVADALLAPFDRFVLWQWALDALATRIEATRIFDSVSGEEILVRATAIGDHRPPIGAVLELRTSPSSQRKPPTPSATDPLIETLAGHSRTTQQLRRAVRSAIRDRSHVAVVGPDGAGRTFVARTIAGGGHVDSNAPTVMCAADLADVDARVVIARSISTHAACDVEDLLAAADARKIRVIATADVVNDDGPAVRCFDHRVEVPSLTQRIDDLPVLVARLLADLSDGQPRRPMRPDAMSALMRHDWPGNIGELRAVLAVAVAAAGERELTVFHLPEALRRSASTNRWTAIELAEREAIIRALNEHQGNKVAAAAALGVARSTLYRKLRALQIDLA